MAGDGNQPGYVRADDKEAVLRRLKRIEGQIRGVHRMIEDETYCIDVVTQISAVKSGLDRVTALLVEDHIAGCVQTAVNSGDHDAIDHHLSEIGETLTRLLKT